MKILFGLGWEARSRLFKDKNAAALFDDYRSRINREFTCEAASLPESALSGQAGKLWICEREKRSKTLSSMELSQRLKQVCDSGVKSLTVWIGGPDGIAAEKLSALNPDLIWSFGPMTLPHELASVVAAEQIYRAISILKKHPYHSGH